MKNQEITKVFKEAKQDAKQCQTQETTNKEQNPLVKVSTLQELRSEAVSDIENKQIELDKYQYTRFIRFTHDCIRYGIVSLKTAKEIKKRSHDYTVQYTKENVTGKYDIVETITNDKNHAVYYGFKADPKTCKNYITIYKSTLEAYSFAYNVSERKRKESLTKDEKEKEKNTKEYNNIIEKLAKLGLSEDQQKQMIDNLKLAYGIQ